MPRRARCTLPDGAFHVMAHAAPGLVLFRSVSDCKYYLGLLQRSMEQCGWRVLTFVLMPNHFHVILKSTASALSDGMWAVQSGYAHRYKRRYGTPRGQVFDARFKSKPITTEPYLYAAIRYVSRNPVDARLATRPEQFRWSADRAIRGLSPAMPLLALDDVLALWNGSRDHFAAFVDGIDPPAYDVVRRDLGGPIADRPPLDDLLVDDSPGTMLVAHDRWGYSLDEIAVRTGVHRSSVHRRIARARVRQVDRPPISPR